MSSMISDTHDEDGNELHREARRYHLTCTCGFVGSNQADLDDHVQAAG